MNIFRYLRPDRSVQLAVLTPKGEVYDLPQPDFQSLVREARSLSVPPAQWIEDWLGSAQPRPLDRPFPDLTLSTPVDAEEVWAAGVTYEKSREARNYEATQGKLDARTFYDKVYEAERPEIFLKSTRSRTVPPEGEMCLRSDSHWQIPEPELGLVLMKDGAIAGYTVGNDLSCRDIEGENPLYLPQAKVWKRSCSIGPTIRLAETVADPYRLDITCRIYRGGRLAFEGEAQTGQLKRRLNELVAYLIRDNETFEGMVLLTGTCIVPPNEFTLEDGDVVEIEISGIGVLRNPMKQL